MIRKTQPDARMVMTKATGERSAHAARDIAVLHSGANRVVHSGSLYYVQQTLRKLFAC